MQGFFFRLARCVKYVFPDKYFLILEIAIMVLFEDRT